MWLLGIPLVPIFCVIYIISPKSKVSLLNTTQYSHLIGLCCLFISASLTVTSHHVTCLHAQRFVGLTQYPVQNVVLDDEYGVLKVGDAMRCPASKFITHTLSNLTFLILLTVATFQLGNNIHPITSTEDLTRNRFNSLTYDQQVDSLLRNTFRPANQLITNVQTCIMVWILGQRLISSSHSRGVGKRGNKGDMSPPKLHADNFFSEQYGICHIRVTNMDVLSRTGQRRLQDIVAERRLRMVGHIIRMPPGRPANHAMSWTPRGSGRRRGRPTKTWRSTFKEDLVDRGVDWNSVRAVATNRGRWRTLAAHCPVKDRRI